jgi:hypothetical protein
MRKIREAYDKVVWGHMEKIGKGTRANYNPDKKTLTFCFSRGPQTSAEQLKKLRETLLGELKELGYVGKMKYNGEVIADNVEPEDVVLNRINHQLKIRLSKKGSAEKEKNASDQPTNI